MVLAHCPSVLVMSSIYGSKLGLLHKFVSLINFNIVILIAGSVSRRFLYFHGVEMLVEAQRDLHFLSGLF